MDSVLFDRTDLLKTRKVQKIQNDQVEANTNTKPPRQHITDHISPSSSPPGHHFQPPVSCSFPPSSHSYLLLFFPPVHLLIASFPPSAIKLSFSLSASLQDSTLFRVLSATLDSLFLSDKKSTKRTQLFCFFCFLFRRFVRPRGVRARWKELGFGGILEVLVQFLCYFYSFFWRFQMPKS